MFWLGLTAEQQHQLELQEAEQLVAAAEQLHAQEQYHASQPQTQTTPSHLMARDHHISSVYGQGTFLFLFLV